MKNASIITQENITVMHGGVHTLSRDHEQAAIVIDLIREGNFDGAVEAINKAKAIEHFACGHFVVEGDVVTYGDKEVGHSLIPRILQMRNDGFDITPMLKFLENLFQNPSNRAQEELYRFLEANELPITEDGHFMAYKRINNNWTDRYSGKIDNSVGKVVEMPRNEVDDNCNNTCSRGLHFCGLGYLRSFGGQRLVALKINPRDVVSIPTDYNDAKGRCCRYQVAEELPLELVHGGKGYWDTSVVGSSPAEAA